MQKLGSYFVGGGGCRGLAVVSIINAFPNKIYMQCKMAGWCHCNPQRCSVFQLCQGSTVCLYCDWAVVRGGRSQFIYMGLESTPLTVNESWDWQSGIEVDSLRGSQEKKLDKQCYWSNGGEKWQTEDVDSTSNPQSPPPPLTVPKGSAQMTACIPMQQNSMDTEAWKTVSQPIS